MISKKKLKTRLLDICAGAGMDWQEEYFHCEDSELTCAGHAIIAIERQFDLGTRTRVRQPFRLNAFDHIDTLTELVYKAIEFDATEKKYER